MNIPQFIHLIDGLLHLFQFGALKNKATLNILVYVFWHLPLPSLWAVRLIVLNSSRLIGNSEGSETGDILTSGPTVYKLF